MSVAILAEAFFCSGRFRCVPPTHSAAMQGRGPPPPPWTPEEEEATRLLERSFRPGPPYTPEEERLVRMAPSNAVWAALADQVGYEQAAAVAGGWCQPPAAQHPVQPQVGAPGSLGVVPNPPHYQPPPQPQPPFRPFQPWPTAVIDVQRTADLLAMARGIPLPPPLALLSSCAQTQRPLPATVVLPPPPASGDRVLQGAAQVPPQRPTRQGPATRGGGLVLLFFVRTDRGCLVLCSFVAPATC